MLRSVVLITAGVMLIGAMTVIVPLVTAERPGLPGYIAVLGVYWLVYCLPVGFFLLGGESMKDLLSFRLRGAIWVPVVVLAQPVGYALYSLPQELFAVPISTIAAAVAIAAVNGPLEEIAWRGAYLKASGGNVVVQAVGVWIFAFWHAPLLLASGMDFGTFAAAKLLGGSFLLGSLWAFVTWRTGAIGWPIVGHVLTNVIAFSLLIHANA